MKDLKIRIFSIETARSGPATRLDVSIGTFAPQHQPSHPAHPMTPTRTEKRPNTVAQVVAWLFALVLIGLGALSIWDAHFVGVTRRSVTVVSEGVSAQWLGGLQISLGLLMLGVAMPNKRAALRWMLACVALGAVCLVMALRTH